MIKSKECIAVGCHNPVFAKGWCKWHQYMRTDKPNKPPQRTNKPLSKSKGYISPVSKNKRSDGLEMSFGFSSQKEMFGSIWKSRSHVCELSGANLDKVPLWQRHWCFAHILAKGKYPLWKLNPENILLVHPNVHRCVDNFTEDMRMKYEYDFDKWELLVDQMKQKYIEFLTNNNI